MSSIRHPQRLVNLAGAFAVVASDSITAAGDRLELATSAESAALNLVGHAPGLSIDDVAKGVSLTHAGTVRLVDRLVEARLVERRQGPDRRTVALRLTRSGTVRRARLQAERLASLGSLLAPLAASERDELERLFAKLLASHVRDGRTAMIACRFCDEAACASCPVEASLDGA